MWMLVWLLCFMLSSILDCSKTTCSCVLPVMVLVVLLVLGFHLSFLSDVLVLVLLVALM